MARKSREEAGAELAKALTTLAPQGGLDFGSIDIPMPDLGGDAKAAADRAALVNGVANPVEPPKDKPRVLPSGEMDYGELVYRLKQSGFDVKIGNVSQWTLVERLQAREWVEGAAPNSTVPEFLRSFAMPLPPHLTTGPVVAVHVAEYVRQARVRGATDDAPAIQEALDTKLVDPIPPPPPSQSMVAPASPHTDTDRHPPPLFTTANKGAGISTDFARIVETIHAVDALKDYEELEANLEVGEDRGDRATLRIHLDKAQKRSRRAHHLLLGAKLEFARWEQESKKVMGAMRGEASATLEAEKAAGERKKAITNPDVEAKMSELFADEYAAQEIMRVKMKGVIDDMEHLAKCWNAKASDLRTLLETLPR